MSGSLQVARTHQFFFMSILLQTLKIHHNLAETKTLQIQLQ